MAHIFSQAAEEILDKEFRVLDKGFVRLVDYMGSDERIVAAARVSYGQGLKTPEPDERLIKYLIDHDHTSPLEQVVITFHMKLPILTARQIIRHRTARVSEISARYSKLSDDFYIPDQSRILGQDTNNKQGSAGELDIINRKAFVAQVEASSMVAYKVYSNAMDYGVSRELARMLLPVNIYTEWYWQMDLHNLCHFLKLRLDSHAQWEAQQYARVILMMATAVAPTTMKAFKEGIGWTE